MVNIKLTYMNNNEYTYEIWKSYELLEKKNDNKIIIKLTPIF